jgi:hypothetical protein
MLDRIATAELQLEPNPSPGAVRTRRWREKKAEENGTAGNPAPTEQTFNGDSDDDAENPAPGRERRSPSETSPSVTERHTEPVTPRDTSPSDTAADTDFDWGKNAADIVQHQTNAVALYLNPKGFLVIRRAAQWPSEEDDAVITIAPERQQAFVDRVCDLMGIGGVP